MSPRAADGTPHHSLSRAKFHDDMAKEKGAVKAGPESTESQHAGEHEGGMHEAHPPDSKESIHDVVAEHGPAHTIHSHHDHEAGHHHVTSYHGEHHPGHTEGHGFTHHSSHHDVQSSHAHVGHALGMGGGEEHDHEQYESPATESAEMSRAGGGIPGM